MEYPLFLSGGGRAADAIMARDWSVTPLGPMDMWPQSLRTALGMMLASHFPKAIVWGEALITFHNDAFLPILGDKPDAIGRRFDDVWAEIWPDLQPMVERAYAGEATFIEDFPLVIRRYGYPEETYFTFCYSPIRDETGNVAGMMDTVIETTQTVLSQRQIAVVNGELSHRMRNMLTMVTAITNMSLLATRNRCSSASRGPSQTWRTSWITSWPRMPVFAIASRSRAAIAGCSRSRSCRFRWH